MRPRSSTRLMSTRCAGRASRKLSSGTSDCPPARTFASSSEASIEQASSTVRGAWYSKGGGFKKSRPIEEDDRPAEGGLAALKTPGEAAEGHLLVERLVQVAAEVLDVDHVV